MGVRDPCCFASLCILLITPGFFFFFFFFLVLSVHVIGLDIDKKILYLYNRRIAVNNIME